MDKPRTPDMPPMDQDPGAGIPFDFETHVDKYLLPCATAVYLPVLGILLVLQTILVRTSQMLKFACVISVLSMVGAVPTLAIWDIIHGLIVFSLFPRNRRARTLQEEISSGCSIRWIICLPVWFQPIAVAVVVAVPVTFLIGFIRCLFVGWPGLSA